MKTIMSRTVPAAVLLAMCLVLSAGAAALSLTGKVLQVMKAGRYVYVEVADEGKSTWAATTTFDVNVGDTVTFSRDMPMREFFSKELKRTFAQVYFVSRIDVHGRDGAVPRLPAGHPAPAGPRSISPAQPDLSAIVLPQGALSVADLFARRESLPDKPITVHGRVVKFSGPILGRNWLHLRDGTGAAEIGTTGERAFDRREGNGKAPEETVPRVGKMHVVTGAAGELVVSLDDRFQGKDSQLLDPVSQSPDREADGVKGVVPLSVALLAEEDGAVSVGSQRNLEVVLAGHLVGEGGLLMAATAGKGVVGIGSGLEVDFSFHGPVEVQVGGDRSS